MYLGEEYHGNREKAGKYIEYLEKYKRKPQQEYNLPQTEFVTGEKNAPLIIYVFTDPLCSACRTFHKIENILLTKYDGRISFHSYYFPSLSCEKNSMKPACTATQVLFAAQRAGRYDSVIVNHFDRYETMVELYNSGDISKVIAEISVDINMQEQITGYYDDEKTYEMMLRHIELANELNLSATPTLIINGRMMEGFPRLEYMEKIIDFELGQVE